MIQPWHTELILKFVLLAMGGLEMAALCFGAPGSAISDVARKAARENQELVLFAGLVVGHLFWR